MTLFEEIVKNICLLTEDAQISSVNDAINGMHPAIITYNSNDGKPSGKRKRVIYPVAYGISTAGNPVVRAFQKQGSTETVSPHWKLFRLDRMTNWRTVTSRKYQPTELIGFKEDGDDQIDMLYSIAPIGNAKKAKLGGDFVKLKDTPITKGDVKAENDPEYAKKNNYYSSGNNGQYNANDIVNDIVSSINRENETGKTVDDTNTSDYNNSKWQHYRMNATDSDPVFQDEVPGGENSVVQGGEESQVDKTEIGDEPISKDDLEKVQEPQNQDSSDNAGNNEEDLKNNPAVGLMKRMDDLS